MARCLVKHREHLCVYLVCAESDFPVSTVPLIRNTDLKQFVFMNANGGHNESCLTLT